MRCSFFVVKMIVMVVHSSFLAILATALVSSEIVQARKSSLAAQMMPLADEMFMFRSMACHVSSKVGAFSVQELVTNVTVGLVIAGVRGQMRHENLFVHERLGAAWKRALKGATIVVGIGSC